MGSLANGLPVRRVRSCICRVRPSRGSSAAGRGAFRPFSTRENGRGSSDGLAGKGSPTWQDVTFFLRNTTGTLAAFATIQFDAVTDLMRNATNNEMQESIRQRVDHTLNTVDYTTAVLQYAYVVVKDIKE